MSKKPKKINSIRRQQNALIVQCTFVEPIYHINKEKRLHGLLLGLIFSLEMNNGVPVESEYFLEWDSCVSSILANLANHDRRYKRVRNSNSFPTKQNGVAEHKRTQSKNDLRIDVR